MTKTKVLSIVTAWDRCRPGSTPLAPALWTVRPTREDIRLSTRHRVFIDLTENELVDAIEPKRSYQILGPDRKIAAVAEARYCCMLAHRKLIIGTARVKENRRELTSLRIAPRATIGQIKCVMRLKPPRVQIANAATVVKVLPQTYTHRDSLPVEREYDRLKLSIAAAI